MDTASGSVSAGGRREPADRGEPEQTRPAGSRTLLGWPRPAQLAAAARAAVGWPRTRADSRALAAAAAAGPSSLPAQASQHVSRETPQQPRFPEPAPDDRLAETTGRAGSGVPTAADLADAPVDRAEHRDTPLAVATEQEIRLANQHRAVGQLDPPARTRVVVVANQKGGVGKTTTAVNVAAGLAQWGQQVLIVDLDPQGNASTALGVDHSEGTPGAYQALIEERPIGTLVRPAADVPGLSVLPASIDLAGAEIDLVSLVAREARLRRALTAYLAERETADDRLDYVFIDCPPSLGLLTINALVAGEEILVPIQCEYYALEGVGQLMRTVDMVRSHLNPALLVSVIVLTMHDARTRLSAGVADEVRTHFPDQVLSTSIPRSVRISEAPSYQQTVMTYDPSSPGAVSYLEAAREINDRGAPPVPGGTP